MRLERLVWFFLYANLFRSFPRAFFLFFSFPFFSKFCFAAHFLVFCMKIRLAKFPEKEEIYLERVVGVRRNWQWIFSQKCFICASLAGLVRIFQNEVSVQVSILPELVTYQLNRLNLLN